MNIKLKKKKLMVKFKINYQYDGMFTCQDKIIDKKSKFELDDNGFFEKKNKVKIIL